MIKLDAVINDKKLLASIQKGVDIFNKSTAGRSKLNLKINEKGFRQPLGRITGDLDKFESALAASNARVIAFGASTAVIGGMTAAFKALAETTINVQKSFADINRILNVSNKEFEKFSNNLFDIGRKTATSFDDASKAALEFARQGLGMNETLKRTADALVLVRLTGVNADKAVSALTATVNAFQQSSLTTTEALNKFVAVETKFAVSAKDLMDGLGRVGSAAVDAKVSFDELNAMVAAVQQQTGRGGAVIGNALKTIFTRLQRRDTLVALESFNVQVQDMEGNMLPAMRILQNFAKTYDTLTDANKSYLREQVAGVFQANILSAIVKDINSEFQVYNRALATSTAATNEASMANARLNQTISALISQTGTELIRLQENIGKVTFEPIARAILGPFREVITTINGLLDGEGMGSEFANGILKGIRNIVAGPGLVAAIAVIGKIFLTTAAYIAQALPTLVGITTEKQKQAALETTIEGLLRSQAPVVAMIAKAEGDAAKQAGILAAHAAKQELAFKASAASTGMMATNLRLMGMTINKAGAMVPVKGGPRAAGGYVPGFAGEAADVRKGVGGVSSTSRPVHIPNFAFGKGRSGGMVANTGEYVVPNFRGSGSAVFNPAMIRANGGLPQGAKKITAAQGYVPNFAPLSLQPEAYKKGLASLKVGKITGVNTQADQLDRLGHTDLARKLRAGVAAKKAQRAKAKGIGKGGKQQFVMPNKALGVGAIVGIQSRADTGYDPRSGFATIGKGKIANAALSKLVKGPMYAGSSFQIKGVPVGALNKVGGKSKENADAKLVMEKKFTADMNNFMVPALGEYASSIFTKLFKDDGKSFAKDLLQTKGRRVFSKSVEGGIMESALQFAGQKADRFGGDDTVRFDFEEAGKISEPLLDTFFGGATSGIVRADAKRTDTPKSINTLIGKSFGTTLTANKIASYSPIATAIKAMQERDKKGTPKAAGGYVPSFAGRGTVAARVRKGTRGARGAAQLKIPTQSGLTALAKGIDYKIVGGKASFTAVGEQKTFGAGGLEQGGTSLMLADGRLVLSSKPLHGMAAMQAKIPASKIESLVVGGGFHNVNTGKLTFRESDFVQSHRLQQVAGGARGYVPNFAGGGLGAAIGREKAAGIPSSAIRINSSPRFQSPQNPAGLAVTNQFDEPRGLRDVPNFAKFEMAEIMQRAGFDPKATTGLGLFTGDLNKELRLASNEWANNRMSTKELGDHVKSLTKGLGGAAEGTNAFKKEQAKLLKSAKAYGKTLKPGGMGMGGMMALMMVPMVAGQIEQIVGGRTGSAISGGATGGMMGAMMGGMAGGAMSASWAGPVGIGVGLVVGASMGIATSLLATAETATQVNGALQTLRGAIEGNAKGALLYLKAQEELAEAKGMEALTSATLKAANALNAIGDVNLRDQLSATGLSVEDMRKVIDKFVEDQKRQMLLLTAKGAMMGAQENEALGEQMRDWRKAGETGRGSDYRRTGQQALGGLRDIFIAEGLETKDVKGFVDALKSEQGDTISRLFGGFTGQYSDKEVTAALRTAFKKKLESGDVTEKFVSDLAKAIESGLDPDNWSSDAEKELQIFFNTYFVPMFGDKLKEIGEKAAKFDVTKGIAVNYTRDLESFLRTINVTVTDYTDNLLRITEETATRQATKQARAGFLGFRGAGAAFRETRTTGMRDIAGRRRAADERLFKEHATSIMGQIEKVAQNVADLTEFRQNVMFGMQGFAGGGFQAGIDRLRERTPTAGPNIKTYENLIAKLQLAFNEQKAVIDKDEKVQQIKFKALELRATIAKEEHRVAMIQADTLAVNKLLISKEEGKSKEAVARLERGVSAPGALNFMTSMGALGQRQKVETEVFDEQKRLRDKQAISEARGRLIELQNQAKINRITSQLVDSNLKLRTSIDALNATVGGGPTTGGTGVAGGAPRGGGTIAGGGGNLTVTGAPKGLFKFGDKEVLIKAKKEEGERARVAAEVAKREGTFEQRASAQAAIGPEGSIARKDDPRFKDLYGGGIKQFQRKLKSASPEKRKQYRLQASLAFTHRGEPMDPSYKWKNVAEQGDRPDWQVVERPAAPKRSRESVMGAGEKFQQQMAARDLSAGGVDARLQAKAQAKADAEGAIQGKPYRIEGTPKSGWQPWTMPAASPEARDEPNMPYYIKRRGGPREAPRTGSGGWFGLQRAGGYGGDPEAGMMAQAEKFTKTQKGEFFEGMRNRFLGGGLEGEQLSVDQVEHIKIINEEIVMAYKEGDKILQRKLELEAKSVQNNFILSNQVDAMNKKLMELNQNWARLDEDRTTKFAAGLEDGMAQIYREEQTLFNRLGNELPLQFKNNMVGAMESVLDQTANLGDALEGVALAFLRSMRRAFIDSAVSNMMNIGSAMVPSWGLGRDGTKRRGGFISAQGGRLVPGRGSGDKVPILAEPGEFVVNREAVNAIGAGNLNALNTAIPRFQAGGAMNLALKPDSPQLSGYFLSRGNAETEELADAAVEKLQKAQQKAGEKANMKNMLLSTLFSAALSFGMGALGSKFGPKNPKTVLGPGNKTMYRNVSRTGGTFYSGAGRAGAPELPTGWGPQRGGLLNNRAMQRYGLFQGGGSVPVAASAPALGGGGSTNNISINLDLGGGRGSAGDGRSQTESGNSGAPASASASESDARALAEKIKAQVVKVIAEEQRVGGSLSPGGRRG